MEAQGHALTVKALETRSAILSAALTLFAKNGFRATTMRDIATAAGFSLGLTYRYFRSKDELLVAFYERCAKDLRADIENLPPRTVGARYVMVMRSVLTRLTPYRTAFREMGGIYFNPEEDAGLFSKELAYLRGDGNLLFRSILSGASDPPPEKTLNDIATLAYSGYFLILLFWVNDTSAHQASTEKMLTFVEDLITRFRLLLRLPIFVSYCKRLADIVGPMFGSSQS